MPPPTNYDLVPLSRRAAVLVLLYADPKGDLRVVLTMRAKTLSSCKFVYLCLYWCGMGLFGRLISVAWTNLLS